MNSRKRCKAKRAEGNFHVSPWFRLSVEQFDMLHYAGMSLFKIGILLLNLVPYTALHIVRRTQV
ncbi:MAG TPA: hypothetical protein VHV54_03200 [Candidatus Binatia bacterium]|nr:hypothetical protein [Candidatus Binatia bacterium]